jgi:hypothetical protein
MTSPLVEKTRDIILERKNTFCSSGIQARNKITYEYNQQYVCPMVFFINNSGKERRKQLKFRKP